MAKRSPRQAELDSYAWRNGWERGPFRSWTKGRFTIAVSARQRFLIVERQTARRAEVATLDELDRAVSGGSRVGQ